MPLNTRCGSRDARQAMELFLGKGREGTECEERGTEFEGDAVDGRKRVYLI